LMNRHWCKPYTEISPALCCSVVDGVPLVLNGETIFLENRFKVKIKITIRRRNDTLVFESDANKGYEIVFSDIGNKVISRVLFTESSEVVKKEVKFSKHWEELRRVKISVL